MKRAMLVAGALLALAAVEPVGAALGHGDGAGDGPKGHQHGSQQGRSTDGVRVLRGAVVSVDAAQGTIVADIRTLVVRRPTQSFGAEGLPGWHKGFGHSRGSGDDRGRHFGSRHHAGGSAGNGNGRSHGWGRATKRVTIKTDADTSVFRDGDESTIAALQPGDLLLVALIADDDVPLEQALQAPAWVVSAYSKPAFYGFAGAVTAVDATQGTLTVAVKRASAEAKRVLAGAPSSTVTFTTSDRTVVFVNGAPAKLSDLAAGDFAAVGIKAGRGATGQEVLATPATIVFGVTKRLDSVRTAHFAKRAARAARARG